MFIRCTLLFVVLTISWLARASSYMDSSDNLLLDELTKSCPKDGIPVCGIRHKLFFLFSNACLFEKVNKDVLVGESSFKKIPLKYCMYGCEFPCDKMYQPICARNMITYQKQLFVNQCELTKYVCKTNIEYLEISLPECQPPTYFGNSNNFLEKRSQASKAKRRPIPCTNVFKPVCGIYMGVKSSFRNECLLNAENIRFNRDWRTVKNGMCAEDYSNDRPHKEKPAKPHSIKKRSYQNHSYNQYPDEHDFKNHPNVSPNGLYLYMPPAIQTKFLNHDSDNYQDPIPVHKAYDEILNKIILLPPPEVDVRIRDIEDEEEATRLEEPIFEDSVIKPMPFTSNRVNFNYVTDPKIARDINRQTVLLETNQFMENNKENYYTAENLKTDNESEEIATTIDTTTETTLEPKITPATTDEPTKVLNKQNQLKREKFAGKKVECKFGSTPICGMLTNSTVRTFETICDMMTANVNLKNTWTKLHEGACEDCKNNCHHDYQPVCVTRNGVNYTMVNECYYNMGICMDKKSKWQKLGDGECERYTRIPVNNGNSKPGFFYTSSYFISETTPIPNTDYTPVAITSKPLGLKHRKNRKRKINPKRAVNRRSSSYRCCSRLHYPNEFDRYNIKCKCWSPTSPKHFTTFSLYGTQTESYIMRLIKDKDERAMIN